MAWQSQIVKRRTLPHRNPEFFIQPSNFQLRRSMKRLILIIMILTVVFGGVIGLGSAAGKIRADSDGCAITIMGEDTVYLRDLSSGLLKIFPKGTPRLLTAHSEPL